LPGSGWAGGSWSVTGRLRVCVGRPPNKDPPGPLLVHGMGPPRAFAIATGTGRPGSSFARPGRERLDRDRRAAGPVRRGIHRAGRAAATRNPRLLFRSSGVFLLRFAGRQFLGWLFQLPPRIARYEALAVHRERL
jgi:hypothetical protein